MAFIKYEPIEAHWIIVLYANAEYITYFDTLGVEHILKKIRNIFGSKNITTNTYRIQTCNSMMCGYVCIGFIDIMLKAFFFFLSIQTYFFLTNAKIFFFCFC